jgi:hypothetical protein
VSLDTTDPPALASFYCQLLDYCIVFESESFIALKGAGVGLSVQQVNDYRAPDWPDTQIPKQIHFGIAVKDLEVAEMTAPSLGATKASVQPSPQRWRVLLDPAGHPFCITTLIPEDF